MNFLSWVKRKDGSKVQTMNNFAAEWYVAEQPENLLAQACYVELLRELKSLISITPHHFEELYLQPLYALASLVQQLPYPRNVDKTKKFLEMALEKTITALKFRRGYMLPLGADTETCYREQDAWTYAIFTAVLFQDCWLIVDAFQIEVKLSYAKEIVRWQPLLKPFIEPKTYYRFNTLPVREQWKSTNAVFIKSLLSEKALNWLSGYSYLFLMWWDSVTTQKQLNNPISEILQRVKASILNTCSSMEEKTNTVAINSTEFIAETKTQAIGIAETKPKQENSHVIPENSTALSNPMNKQSDTIVAQLLQCLKHELKQIKLTVNQPNSFIHCVPEGIFLVMPDTMAWLASHCAEFKSIDVNKLEKQLFQALSESSPFIKNMLQNSFLHRYFLGRWDERYVLAGLLLPCEILFNPAELPPVNNELHLEPAI